MILADRQLLWTPKSKERPRFRVAGKKVITYTPQSTVKAQDALGAQWGDADPIEGSIAVNIDLFNDRIQVQIIEWQDYTQRKLRADIDNYAKLILDGLNGVAFVDDAQIVGLSVRKM